jgi:hypothetical protein
VEEDDRYERLDKSQLDEKMNTIRQTCGKNWRKATKSREKRKKGKVKGPQLRQ